jgi:GNAT superfamily N-acetyltransferase
MTGRSSDPVRIWSLAERPELETPGYEVMAAGWPAFILASEVATRHWPRVLGAFAAFQAALVEEATGTVVGMGYSVPFAWDGTVAGLPAGWDGVVERAVDDLDRGRPATIAAALSITLARSHHGLGLSRRLLGGLRAIAAAHGLGGLVAPVRPTLKSRYPLTPMERYMRWTGADGAPFDPWLRVHWRLGAELLEVCPASMRITGTVADWEAWTGMRFPESGSYVVPDALVPVDIDMGRDLGTYVEPNVWVRHQPQARWTQG